MLEILVALVVVVIFQLFSLKRALAVIATTLGELATNPIKHHVDVTSDMRDIPNRLADIDLTLDVIRDEVQSIRRSILPDEDDEV